ncbi:unnamed protein product [Kuraishia capsulata CBS 1993]|uniref:Major facilitator superfamily (MFS) profile domain-containing protein n=1 Tax=Kuraishia capsulata CBS 1993 TaxID=1382522 RepID=W6MN10_9ASCO|nr:uncharacterized protein KUCA_T00003974001 [Kuraishia capsulata CBS 1993]CDK27994.1 unnamed protein product [Kuraishia capsulata CBS 1993]
MGGKDLFTRYFRATLTQSVIIGILSFTQPGIWSAIANLGAGGLQSVNTSNTANAILFGIMVVFAPFYAVLINKFGVKPVVSVGTIGYVFWSAGLYKNSKDGSEALIIAGAVLCGISAAAFWTSEATVAILYPEPSQRGKFISIWQAINKVGGLIAGAITLAMNISGSTSGSVSLNTYVALLSIQCLGLPISFLLSPPEKLLRTDGKRLISNKTGATWKDEFRLFGKIFMKKEVLAMAPFYMSIVWYGTYQSNYVTHHFSVRARALNSLLTALIGAFTDVLSGIILDMSYFKRSTRVKGGWVVTVVFMTAYFIYSFILQKQFDDNPETGIDWSGNPRFNKAFIPVQIFKIGPELGFTWAYWVIGAYQFSSSEIPHVSATIRSLESLGQCFAFVVGTVNESDMTNLAVSAAVFFASVIPTTYIVLQANDDVIHGVIEDSDDGEIDSDKNVSLEVTNVAAVDLKSDSQ